MKISEGGRGVFLLKEWTTHSLSRGLVIKLRWQMHIFVFWLSQTRKRSLEEMELLD